MLTLSLWIETQVVDWRYFYTAPRIKNTEAMEDFFLLLKVLQFKTDQNDMWVCLMIQLSEFLSPNMDIYETCYIGKII